MGQGMAFLAKGVVKDINDARVILDDQNFHPLKGGPFRES